MKMTRWSPDERLRTVADCLSRLRDLGPDPITSAEWTAHPPRFIHPFFIHGPGPVLGSRWWRVSAVFRNRSCGRRRPLYYTITFNFRVKITLAKRQESYSFFFCCLMARLIRPMHLVTGIPLGHPSVHHHIVLHPQAPSSLSSCARRPPVAVSRESLI